MSENLLDDVELHLFCNMFFGGREARRRALVGDWRTVEGVAGFFVAGSTFEAFLFFSRELCCLSSLSARLRTRTIFSLNIFTGSQVSWWSGIKV